MTTTETELTIAEQLVRDAGLARRDAIDEADRLHKKALAAANARFASVVRDAGVPITRVTQLVDVNRQRIHDILRSHPTETAAPASPVEPEATFS